jgi:TonB dependent receptor
LQPDRNNFAPRVGIAYQLSPKTVVRASYAVFYDSFGVNYGQTQQGNRGNWPFAFPQTAASLNAGLPDAIFPNVFPTAAQGSSVPLV